MMKSKKLEVGDLLQTKQNIIITVMEVSEVIVSVSWYKSEEQKTIFESYCTETIYRILNSDTNPWIHHKP